MHQVDPEDLLRVRLLKVQELVSVLTFNEPTGIVATGTGLLSEQLNRVRLMAEAAQSRVPERVPRMGTPSGLSGRLCRRVDVRSHLPLADPQDLYLDGQFRLLRAEEQGHHRSSGKVRASGNVPSNPVGRVPDRQENQSPDMVPDRERAGLVTFRPGRDRMWDTDRAVQECHGLVREEPSHREPAKAAWSALLRHEQVQVFLRARVAVALVEAGLLVQERPPDLQRLPARVAEEDTRREVEVRFHHRQFRRAVFKGVAVPCRSSQRSAGVAMWRSWSRRS